jgi:excisionase family DNA binding protein
MKNVGPVGSASEPFEPLLTARDVARQLNVSKAWVYLHAEAGTLPSVRIGGLRRFVPEAIRAYVRGEWKPTGQVVPFPPRRP